MITFAANAWLLADHHGLQRCTRGLSGNPNANELHGLTYRVVVKLKISNHSFDLLALQSYFPENRILFV